MAKSSSVVKRAYVAYVIEWEESERGWGCRPDGYSLHVSPEEAKTYIDDFWEQQKEFNRKYGIVGVPDEYSRPVSGTPETIPITSKAAKALTEAHSAGKHGIRFHRRDEFAKFV